MLRYAAQAHVAERAPADKLARAAGAATPACHTEGRSCICPPIVPPFVWDEPAPIIAELTANVGEASTVKVTVIGRPTQVSSGKV